MVLKPFLYVWGVGVTSLNSPWGKVKTLIPPIKKMGHQKSLKTLQLI
jgi:hypothetical protein